MGLGLPLMKDVTLSSVKYVAGNLKFMGPYGAMNTLQISLPRILLWCWFCIFFVIWIATSLLDKRRESPSDHQALTALIFIQKNPAALFLLRGGLCFRPGVSQLKYHWRLLWRSTLYFLELVWRPVYSLLLFFFQELFQSGFWPG